MEEESLIEIPNLNNCKAEKAPATILSKSIENKDLTYIQEFLVSKSRGEEIKKLSSKSKEQLAMLVVEFLDQPLRLEAIACIYDVLNDVGSVDKISKKLIERMNDFNKLIYIKGKIDYLKYLERTEKSSQPENEYTE